MKWKTKPDQVSLLGTRRIRRGFLCFPMYMEGIGRWLENAKWCEEFQAVVKEFDTGWGSRKYNVYKWVPIYWLDT